MHHIILLLVCFVLVGCHSTQSTASKRLTSIALTVQSADNGWNKWACDQGATAQQIAEIKLARAKYDVAMTAAQGAYLSLGSTGDTNEWCKAKAALQSSSESLLELIHSYTIDAYGDASTNLVKKPR